MPALRTTRPIRPVTGIDDIRAIEALPYDQAVPARNLHDLLRATARDGGDRPALTVLNGPDPDDIGLSLTHAGLLGAVRPVAAHVEPMPAADRKTRSSDLRWI